MTDLRDRLDSILGDEPAHPDNLAHIIAAGRRARRRRNALTGAAGTAGVAALTAAVVPVIASGSNSGQQSAKVTVQATASPPRCHTFHFIDSAGHPSRAAAVHRARQELRKKTAGPLYRFHASGGVVGLSTCSKSARAKEQPTATPTASPTPTETLPPYHYTESPGHISARLGAHLAHRLRTWGFAIVYRRTFTQETTKLQKGHPRYFDGNDDVRVAGKLTDVGLQVTHGATRQVPFSGPCSAPQCVQTTLPDGSVQRIARTHAGTGGGTVVTVEIHHPDGLEVVAQQSNCAFGPEATRARSRQPLTMAQLKSLAADPSFVF